MRIENIIFTVVLWFIFGFQHSFLAQKFVKNYVGKIFGQNFLVFGYRFFYFVSQCIIFPVFWHLISIVEPGKTLFEIPENFLPYLYIINILSQYILLFSVLLVDVNHFIGTKQLYLYIKNKIKKKELPNENEVKKTKLNINYLFNIVRHPMYLGIILVFISSSSVFTEKTILNLLCLIIYIEAGIYYEERQLIREYKENYINYKKNTPKINPLFHILKIFR